MVLISLTLQFYQESRAEGKFRALRDPIAHTSQVRREGRGQETRSVYLFPGDIVHLSVGDLNQGSNRY